jgi:hypothetical protein
MQVAPCDLTVGNMEQRAASRRVRAVLGLALAVAALVQSGCLIVAAGVVGGAAATGYFYYKGQVCQEYFASLGDTLAAVRAALADLQFPVTSEESNSDNVYVTSRTADGSTIRLKLDLVPSRVPAEGTLTRVCVRIGTFGDEPLSKRILDQIGLHLVPTPTAQRPPLPPPSGPLQPAGYRPRETAPPPLAGPGPGK